MSSNRYQSQRERVDEAEYLLLEKAGAISLDSKRSRPLWFDGRFLKAFDLNMEQNFFMLRQDYLAAATGVGVAEGLFVDQTGKGGKIVIQSGFGTTFDGKMVVLEEDFPVDLNDIPAIRQVNVKMGLGEKPTPAFRASSGLFVLSLRPVEYTSNPMASYPTHIDDSRSVHDGDIIEAAAVTLTPFDYETAIGAKNFRRAYAANRIFVEGLDFEGATSALPLAMIALDRGNIRWVDNYLVRRDMGAKRSDPLSFGQPQRMLKEAHLRQYLDHLEDLIKMRQSTNSSLDFSAATHFLSLPSAGKLPAASVNLPTMTQAFFPPDMNVEISFVPEDEIPALVEESLLLPAIDLSVSNEALESTYILILAPVKRHKVAEMTKKLGTKPVFLKPKGNKPIARLKPIEMVDTIRARFPFFEKTATAVLPPVSASGWTALISSLESLWYVRRRSISFKDEIVGESIKVSVPNELEHEENLNKFIDASGIGAAYKALKARGSTAANLSMIRLLGSERFKTSKILLASAVKELAEKEVLDEKAVLTVASNYGDKKTGEGISRLEAVVMENTKRSDGTTIKAASERNRKKAGKLVDSNMTLEIDSLVKRMSGEKLALFGSKINEILGNQDSTPEDVATFVKNTKRTLRP